jgi:hypothetical protein
MVPEFRRYTTDEIFGSIASLTVRRCGHLKNYNMLGKEAEARKAR